MTFARRLLASIVAWSLAGCGEDRVQVVAYVAVDQQIAEPVLARFEAATGVQVRAVYDAEAAKTSGLVARLLAEADRPRCDVFWNNEPVQTMLLAQREALAPHRSPAAADLPAELREGDLWTPLAARARVIVYNSRHVPADEAPRGLADLADPKWRGRLAVANPQFGTTRTHVAALFATLGPERAQRLLLDLRANGARIVDGNAMVKNLVARASPEASPIYVGLTDTDDVLAGQADGEPVEMVFPDQDGLGTLVLPTTLALVRGAPHPEIGQQLIDYLAGIDVERQLVGGRWGFLPLRTNVDRGAALARFGAIRPMQVAPDALLEQLEPSSQWTRAHFAP